jgi:hypothetical protein
METLIQIKLPLKRVKKHSYSSKWSWLFSWGGATIAEFGGSRENKIRHLLLFRWHVLTIRRNQYHDRSDSERADEYLKKWSECEKELRGLRLLLLGDSTNSEVKKLIRDSLGVDLDEGRIL